MEKHILGSGLHVKIGEVDIVFFYFLTSQVTGNANCLAASGDYVFIGLCTGLAVYSISHCEKLCAWDAVKFEICVIRVSVMDNSCYLLGTVDEMGRCNYYQCVLFV